MNQHQILINRTLNFIETLKHQIYSTSDIQIYNDLLILKVIVPGLPKNTLRSLLKELKPHNTSSSGSEQESEFKFNFSRIMRILSQAQKPSHLLSDFLICAGYNRKQVSCKE